MLFVQQRTALRQRESRRASRITGMSPLPIDAFLCYQNARYNRTIGQVPASCSVMIHNLSTLLQSEHGNSQDDEKADFQPWYPGYRYVFPPISTDYTAYRHLYLGGSVHTVCGSSASSAWCVGANRTWCLARNRDVEGQGRPSSDPSFKLTCWP
jgi:hypothetical protein